MAFGSGGRKITVEFIGDASALKGGINDAEGALTGFSGKAQAAGRIAGKVLAGGLLLAGAAAVSATKAAAEDEAAQSQLAQQLRQAAGASDSQIASTESWISAQGKATGITDDELRPALARLATATGDVGEAQRLAALAMDVSAGSGKSYQQVTEALAKAQNGNIGALGRLGIATKDADGKTKSLADIQQDLADKYNGAASKAAETTAGKQKILTTQMGELQEQIGAKLLPVMVKLSEIGLKVVDWISQNTTTVGVLVGSFGALLAITTAVGFATKAFGAIQTVWTVITKAAAAGQWLLNAAMTANPIGLVVVAIAALVGGLILAYKHSETFRNIVNAAFSAVMSVVKPVIDWFATTIPAVFGAVVDFIKQHWQLIVSIIGGPLVAIGILVVKHWGEIKSFIGNAIDAVIGFLKSLPGKAVSAMSSLVGNVRDLFRSAMDAGLEKVRGIGGTIVGWIAEIPGKLLDKLGDFKNAGKSLIGGVVDGMKNAAGVIEGIASNVWNAVKGLLNSAIDKINSALEFTISLPGPDITVNPPNIPHLAKGGIVSRPTLALIGEDGPEAVVPLGAKNAPRGRLSVGGGGDTFVFQIQTLDPAAAGKAVVDALRAAERRTGRKLLASPS